MEEIAVVAARSVMELNVVQLLAHSASISLFAALDS